MAFRKAQIEIHFSWIFALIAGAVILGFFIFLIRNIQDRATIDEKDRLASDIDTLLAGITTTPETFQVIEDLPEIVIEFTCEDGISTYHVKGSQQDKSTDVETIFTPTTFSGEKLLAWTLIWRMPFPASTFTYLSDDRTLFVFVGTQPLAQDIFDEMPVGFPKQLVSLEDMDTMVPRGYERYRYILVGGADMVVGEDVPSLGGETTEVFVDLLPSGFFIVSFGDAPSDTIVLPGKEAMWAAVFSDDRESYECGMKKAYRRLDATATLLQNRSGAIAQEMISSPCYDYFYEAASLLGEIATAARNGNGQAIADPAERLAYVQDIATRFTCPDIY